MSIAHATSLDAPHALSLDESYVKVCEINDAAGNHANAGWPAADHQIRVIDEEFNKELVPGVDQRDIKEVRDGLADTVFTLFGLAHRLGIDLIKDLEEVVRSNLTKFDYTSADAHRTAAKYAALGVEVHCTSTALPTGGHRWVTFSSKDQTDIYGKKYLAGKWLKSHAFKDVEFAPLPDDNQLVKGE